MTAPTRALAIVGLVLVFLLTLAPPRRAAAHPLGNFTVNQYSRIEVSPADLQLVYVLDMAEIPTFQEMDRVDTDGNGSVDDAERAAYLNAKLTEIAPALHFWLGGTALPLTPTAPELSFPEGQAGLKLLRLRAVFTAPLDQVAAGKDNVQALTFRNDYAADRLGWKEVVVTHAAGVRFDAADAPSTDRSNELRSYPQDLLSSPLNQTAATLSFAVDPGAAAAPGFRTVSAEGRSGTAPSATRPGGGASGAHFAALLANHELTTAGIGFALLAALFWGALHALSPGHGKTVVGAYLVGSHGTPKHALFLGLTVTLTHTAGVLALGLVTLFASRYVVPEQLYPWVSVLSGLLVAGMGLTIFRQRLRGHPAFGHHHHHHDHDLADGHAHQDDHHHHAHLDADHGHVHHHAHGHDHGHLQSHGEQPHSHLPPKVEGVSALGPQPSALVTTHSHLPPGADGAAITWRSLLALGVSGGLVPCPSALVVLLGSIALGRVGFGLLLVLAFSFGLAAALTAVGLLFLYAGRFIERRLGSSARTMTFFRYVPAAGALVLTFAGLAIVLRALSATRLF